MRETADKQLILTPALDIPNTPGVLYGWNIIVQPAPQKIQWKAELISPPSKGSRDSSANILTSEGAVEPGEKSIAGAWQVDSGDASGQYQVKVYLDGKLATEFRFTLR